MKSIILTDTHMDYDRNPDLSYRKEQAIRSLDKDVDCVLLCGDNAELTSDLSNHKRLFDILKELFNCPIGFVVGNHELWGRKQIPCDELLWKIFPELAKEFNLSYLENENLDIGSFSIVGTYGHYDYSLGNEKKQVSRKNFLSGVAMIDTTRYQWMDKRFMDWQGTTDEEITDRLISAFQQRIDGHSKLITISHTVPDKRSIGYPDSQKQDFFGAYSGTLKLEECLRNSKSIYHFCGHTHAPAKSQINKTEVFNIGTDYTNFKYGLIDTDTMEVQMINKSL